MEEWRPVIGFEGIYEVSNIGRVKSLDRTWVDKRGVTRTWKGRILKMPECHEGDNFYITVPLWKNNHGYDKQVHILVAEAFIPNPDGKPIVDHLDGIKWHNWVDNLEWVTYSENTLRSYDMGLQSRDEACENLIKARVKSNKVTSNKIYCLETDTEYKSQAACARALGIQQVYISLYFNYGKNLTGYTLIRRSQGTNLGQGKNQRYRSL